jgi:acyl-coenzyme A thioesterase PaaI-like protein
LARAAAAPSSHGGVVDPPAMFAAARRTLGPLVEALPETMVDTAMVRAFGLFKVPMILYVRPRVIESSLDRLVVRIPLTRRTRNHWGSMYFGALAIGADLCGGLLAMKHIRRSGREVSLVFKDFQAEFLRRPMSDVDFACDDGVAIAAQVADALESGERVSRPFAVCARCEGEAEPVARFRLGLSLKLVR